MAEKFLGRDVLELIRHEEELGPKFVEVTGDGTEVRRGDSPELAVGRHGYVNDDDGINIGYAYFQDARREELLPGQLINRLVEQVLDSRYGLQIEGRERAIEYLPIRVHAIRAIGTKTFVLGRVALGVLPFDETEDLPAVVGFVADRRVYGCGTGSSYPVRSDMGFFSKVVDVALPLERDEGVFLYGEHMLELREMRPEEVSQGLGTMAEREQGIHAAYLARAGMIGRKPRECGAMPDDSQSIEGSHGVVPDFMEQVVRRIFERKAERIHAAPIEARYPGFARESLAGQLPLELHLFGYGEVVHIGIPLPYADAVAMEAAFLRTLRA